MTDSKIILITGASSGIGAAAAIHLARAGHHVVAGARREDRLRELADSATGLEHGSLSVRRLDVTDRADMAAFVDAAAAAHGRIDVIVNNAGVMPLSRLDALLIDQWDAMIDVNVRGLLNGIAAALPHFQRLGGGHFVTVASIGAHEVVPTSAVYSATKYAAWAITEGLRQESDPSIRVTTVSPGWWSPNSPNPSPTPTPRRQCGSTGRPRSRRRRSPAPSPTRSTNPRVWTSTR